MKRLALLLPLVVLLASCASGKRPGGYYQDDGPHSDIPVDVARVADAVPKWEPVDESRSRPYIVLGHRYEPMRDARGYREQGVASWYGRKFHGRRTATGERYDMYAMTAAHKTLPLPSYARVTNLDNGRAVVVRVNDRGPFLHGRLIDLSYAAAAKLGIVGSGTGRVEVAAVFPGEGAPPAAIAQDAAPQTGAVAVSNTVTGTPLEPVAASNAPAAVAPAAAAVAPVAAAVAPVYVQVGAFSSQGNAEKLRARMEREGLRPVAVHAGASNGNAIYRVRIGPLASTGDTERVMEHSRRIGLSDARVVTE
jgi:rare lipoprotein A